MFAYLHYTGATIFTAAILSLLLIYDPYTYFIVFIQRGKTAKSYNAHKNL